MKFKNIIVSIVVLFLLILNVFFYSRLTEVDIEYTSFEAEKKKAAPITHRWDEVVALQAPNYSHQQMPREKGHAHQHTDGSW